MEKVLNRGLKFCILPLKLDITQVLVDYRRFERTMIWHEFWYGRNTDDDYIPPIFKATQTNLPKNHKVPNGLKTFLGAVKSEILDPKNRNEAKCNLPKDEFEALLKLIQLQKECKIMIKPCDKGAGIIILDYEEYIKACYKHLNAKIIGKNGEEENYYTKVDSNSLDLAKTKIKFIIEEGLDNEILSKPEYEAMTAEDKNPGKFYCTFKVHKDHQEGTTPPERPIISGSGSITENIGKYVEHHIKDLANQHKTYLQDTPDFLRQIEGINKQGKLPPNAILVTVDVSGLYTNIPQQEGMDCTKEALDERKVKEVPTEYIIRLLEIILKHNIFEFNGELFLQEIGTAMGTRPAPPYANLFMVRRIDNMIEYLSRKYKENGILALKFLKRFLDDIFMIFLGSTKNLYTFIEEINMGIFTVFHHEFP